MSFDASEKRQWAQRYHDGELDESSARELEDSLEQDPELKGELEWLNLLGTGLRRDSEAALEAFHEPNFTASLMQRIDAEPEPFLLRLSAALRLKPVLTAGGVFALVWMAVAVFGENSTHRLPTPGENPNDCVIENIENVRSTSIVFETQTDEDPVTVIWVYE